MIEVLGQAGPDIPNIPGWVWVSLIAAVGSALAAFLRSVLLAQKTAQEQGDAWKDQGEAWAALSAEKDRTWMGLLAEKDRTWQAIVDRTDRERSDALARAEAALHELTNVQRELRELQREHARCPSAGASSD